MFSFGVPVLAVASLLLSVDAQAPVNASWPHVYPGMPNEDYSPTWQSYFEVTEPLPNVTFPLERSWAGNILLEESRLRPNDSLFFWGFEKSYGSLTTNQSNDPWSLWLTGGPGASSLLGLLVENGPIHIGPDYSASPNEFAWSNLSDFFWVDQPVGVGYSTCAKDGYVHDETQLGLDFFAFLTNLVKVFPSLATRPLYLIGESYGGTYVPYIMKTYFSLPEPPVHIYKIAIGDGAMNNYTEYEIATVIDVIETYPQLIDYDPEVYELFKEQTHTCGYDLNLTYPQTGGYFPTLEFPCGGICWTPSSQQSSRRLRTLTPQALVKDLSRRYTERDLESMPASTTKREARGAAWKRELEYGQNGTLDPWYLCDLYDEIIDYALNFTFPWNISRGDTDGFDVYSVPDALDPEAPLDIEVFMNDPRVISALHAPTTKPFIQELSYDFDNVNGDPSPVPMLFFNQLATNLSTAGIPIVIYSGNDDSLVSHWGSEVVIQNTTFGGIQGFTRKPSTPWTNDGGAFGGIVHQERNWTFVLVYGAGHQVPLQNPPSALTLFREFILGNNQAGLVLTSSRGGVTVVGGEDPALEGKNLPGAPEVYYGSGTTMSTYVAPSATIAAWESFIASVTTKLPVRTPLPT